MQQFRARGWQGVLPLPVAEEWITPWQIEFWRDEVGRFFVKDDPAPLPNLIEENYRGFNIVHYRRRLLAIALSCGLFEYSSTKA